MWKLLAKDLPGANQGTTTASSIDQQTLPPPPSKGYDTNPSRPTKIVSAACGRHHTLLVGSCGRVWACGKNEDGRCGVPINSKSSVNGTEERWVQVRGPWEADRAKVIQVTAGLTFSLFLADNGWIYASGSHESGQCGNGATGARIIKAGKTAYDNDDRPILIKPFTKAKIVGIASGNQHSLAVCEQGYVWGWGNAGYGKLGLGDQKDRLVPTMIPQFSGSNPLTRASTPLVNTFSSNHIGGGGSFNSPGPGIYCGPTCSIVVDRQGMYQIAGKWKFTGDGSSGAPYTFFKPIQDIVSCKAWAVASGGAGHFLLTPVHQEDVRSVVPPPPPPATTSEPTTITTTRPRPLLMSVAWGQQCTRGELGLGPDMPKNCTKPSEIEPLRSLDVFAVAAGAATTYWLIKPGGVEGSRSDVSALEQLERWPLVIDSEDECIVCHANPPDQEAQLLECEKCETPYHTTCLEPSLDGVPEGEWLCPACVKQGDDEGWVDPLPTCFSSVEQNKKGAVKGKARTSDESPVSVAGVKRKAPAPHTEASESMLVVFPRMAAQECFFFAEQGKRK